MAAFPDKLRKAQRAAGSLLCVGLDPDPGRMPEPLRHRDVESAVLEFNTAILRATAASACAFKLNLAFYESMGSAGWRVLEQTLARIPPGHIVIADGKRGDIGNSAAMYARSVFATLGFDACTVSPYMGRDSVQPFLEFAGKAAFVLCLTSNPGAGDFQKQDFGQGRLYEAVAEQVERWAAGAAGTAGLVVGATRPAEMASLRARHPSAPFLVPGAGSQGGDIEAVLRAAGRSAVLINVSRQIIYASAGADFEEAAGRAAERFKSAMGA